MFEFNTITNGLHIIHAPKAGYETLGDGNMQRLTFRIILINDAKLLAGKTAEFELILSIVIKLKTNLNSNSTKVI